MVENAQNDLTRAALLGAFDPRAIIDVTAKDADARQRALAARATEVQVGRHWLWALTADARREGLARLPRTKADRRALLAELPPGEGDAMAEALRDVLGGGRPPPVVARLQRSAPRGQDLPALLQLMQAVELLRGAGVDLEGWASDPGLAKQLSRVAVQADKIAASEQILNWKLRGRATELAALQRFAKAGTVAAPPFVMAADQPPPAPGAPPTVILSGLGGSGKSALLEALRRQLAKDRSILQVMFDLDEPALRAGHRVALTQELLRQIGEARPDLDTKLSVLRQTLRGGVAATTEGIDPGREASAVFGSLADLNEILMAEATDEPISLVLIFDTFEEALILGPDRVRLIADWIKLVGEHRLRPRVILSGREAATLALTPMPGLALQGSILLGELGVRAGRALLRDRFQADKVDAGDLVPKLVDSFGSDPLTLLMLARFAASLGKKGAALRKDLTGLASGAGSHLREQLDAEMRQTFLFSRILNRLPTRNLRALASPGLVLRQITPRLIQDVLAGPCGLPTPLDLAEAEALFDDLAGMGWLVKTVPGTDRVVEHVPALRRRMLPQVLQEAKAQTVAVAAADWYAARAEEGDATAGLEAIYYRALCRPGMLSGLDPAVLRALGNHLGPAMADLDFASDAFRNARGAVISHEAVEALQDPGAQKDARDRRRKYQLAEGLESGVVAESSGADGPSDAPMSPDLVAGRFAELSLGPVAAEAVALVPKLLDGLVGTTTRPLTKGDMTSDDLQGLSVAALQAATACHAPEVGAGPGEALRGAVRDWLADPVRREALVAGYAGALRQSSQLVPARLAGILVLSLSDQDVLASLGEPVADTVRGMARVSHSPYAWRALRMVGPLRDDVEVKAIALAYLAPEVLPFVTVGVTMSAPAEMAETFKSILKAEAQVSISDHNRIDAALFRAEVVLGDRLSVLGKLPATVPGRLPEFHGSFRLVLGSADVHPAMVQEAVASVSRFVPWWPKELRADAFAEAPFSPTLVSSLIDTADRCGRLPDLATALARHSGATLPCVRLAALVEATVACYRQAAGVGDAR